MTIKIRELSIKANIAQDAPPKPQPEERKQSPMSGLLQEFYGNQPLKSTER